MNSKYTALIIVVLAASAQASSLGQSLGSTLIANQQNWEGLGLQADVNEYIDKTIEKVIPFIQEHGLDPMELPEIVEGFEVKPVWITYSAWLKIHDGHMTGLVNIERSGDQRVHYFANMLRLRLQFQFTDLEFVYRYLVKVMNIGPTGRIYGSLNNFVVVVDLLIDFNNDEIHLQEFSLTDIGRLRVRLTGNILYDWLLNPVISVFTRIFDTTIIRVVETNVRAGVQEAIALINSNVREIVQRLESY